MSSRTEGFLLLEALVGLAIIGMVTLAILAATGSQVRSADKASSLLVAQALAQDRMAVIRFLDGAGLEEPPDSLLAGAFDPPFDEFSWTTVVEPTEEEHGLFAVEVVVAGRGERFPLSTLVHRPPLQATVASEGQP